MEARLSKGPEVHGHDLIWAPNWICEELWFGLVWFGLVWVLLKYIYGENSEVNGIKEGKCSTKWNLPLPLRTAHLFFFSSFFFFFFFFFGGVFPLLGEVPWAGVPHTPQQWSKPLQWQYWILKTLGPRECLYSFLFFLFFFFTSISLWDFRS